jgi:hypothetical protein
VTRRTVTRWTQAGESQRTLLGVCLLASTAGFAVTALFGDYLDAEWLFWLVALMTRFVEISGLPEGAAAEDQVTDPIPWLPADHPLPDEPAAAVLPAAGSPAS